MPATRVSTPGTATASSKTTRSTGVNMPPIEARVLSKGAPGGEREAERLRRANGMLHVIETGVMKNMTRVGPEAAGREEAEGRGSKFGAADTRIEVGGVKGMWDKAGRNGNGGVRKVWKGGVKRWKDLRKRLGFTQRQMVMLLLFVVCLIVIALLLWGDDEDGVADVVDMDKAVMVEEDVHLPSVRVNPALVAEAAKHASRFADENDD
eukprot:GFKZ01012729.1.p2 GENE.GFKZ01012729.1~~GFKZ01012729.1.p2  ORF type:complete len:242 (+),score=42.36 GFKZ01012729.1:104-727(+)